jgi:hypothetical protein
VWLAWSPDATRLYVNGLFQTGTTPAGRRVGVVEVPADAMKVVSEMPSWSDIPGLHGEPRRYRDPHLVETLRRGRTVRLGELAACRDFIYIEDTVDALLALGRLDRRFDVFNVGSGQPQSVNRLAQMIGGRVTRVPRRPGEPDATHADIGKIRRLLGWSPKVSFEEGVRIMLASIGNWKDAPLWTPERIEEATRDWFRYLGDR